MMEGAIGVSRFPTRRAIRRAQDGAPGPLGFAKDPAVVSFRKQCPLKRCRCKNGAPGFVRRLLCVAGMAGMSATRVETPTRAVVMIIESSPNNLDLRQGTDAQSERLGGLVFDALVKKDEHFSLTALAGHELGAAGCLDVGVSSAGWGEVSGWAATGGGGCCAWTIRSMIDGTLDYG